MILRCSSGHRGCAGSHPALVPAQSRTCPPATSTKSPWEVLESSARGQPKHQTAKLVRPPVTAQWLSSTSGGIYPSPGCAGQSFPSPCLSFPSLPSQALWRGLCHAQTPGILSKMHGFSLLQRRAFMENLKLGGVTAFKKKQGERAATAVCCPCPGIASGRGVLSRERPFGEHLDETSCSSFWMIHSSESSCCAAPRAPLNPSRPETHPLCPCFWWLHSSRTPPGLPPPREGQRDPCSRHDGDEQPRFPSLHRKGEGGREREKTGGKGHVKSIIFKQKPLRPKGPFKSCLFN